MERKSCNKNFKHLTAVSDGSVRAKHMTFGWILADDRGQVITQGYGPINGRPSRLRSEAAGMLAVSIFLGFIQEWTNYHFQEIPITIYTDNKILITRQTNHLEYTNPYPNCTLTPEYDLTEEIFVTHSNYNIKATFCHVKGHQDDNQDIEDLSIPAKLNVYADKLASCFYKEGHKSKPQVHETPPIKHICSYKVLASPMTTTISY